MRATSHSSSHRSRQTAAETVAFLKASMAAMDSPGGSSGRQGMQQSTSSFQFPAYDYAAAQEEAYHLGGSSSDDEDAQAPRGRLGVARVLGPAHPSATQA